MSEVHNQMNSLDLERFLDEYVESMAEAVHNAYLATCAKLGWSVNDINKVPYDKLTEESKELDRASVRAVLTLPVIEQLLAELRALRAWRDTMLNARGGSFIDDAYNTAETELNNEIQSNNRG